VNDDDAGVGTDSATVTVSNVAPTATLTNSGPVDEGSPATITFGTQFDPSSVDTAAGFHYAYDCAGGSLAGATYAGSGASASTTCTFDDGPSIHTVRARIIDKDGGASEYTTDVSVRNVPPTVIITGGTSTSPEGTAITLGSAVSDPSVADTIAGFTYAWSVTKNGNPYASGSASGFTFTPDDNGTYIVSLSATDKDGGTGSASKTITVTNVAPTVQAGAATASSAEGSAFTRAGSFTDPGSADTWSATVDYGDGSGVHSLTLAPAKTFNLSHVYADNGSFTITVTVTDDESDSGSDTILVTVTNVAPTVDAGAATGTSAEGSAFTRGGSFTDPGADTWTATVNYGDGSGTTVLALAPDKSFSLSHVYADNGTFTITVTVTDDDSGVGSDTIVVTVSNVAPIVTMDSGATAVNEGDAASHYTYHWTDPGSDTWTRTISCGATGTKSNDVFTPASKTGSFDCFWADDNPTATNADTEIVSVTVNDDDSGADTKTRNVLVSNVAPTITSFTATASFSGPLVFVPSTFTTTFTDAGTDSFRAEFNWGDGSPVQLVPNFHSGDKVDHTYTTAVCGRTATVKVIDDDTGNVTASTTVNTGTGSFLAPMTNQPVTNKLKNGQVLPVKIQLSDCTGAGVTGLTPAIRLVAGDQTAVFDDGSVAITPPSVSGADTNGYMRASNPNGSYIYNMQVNIPLNNDYTVVIYPFADQSTNTLNSGYTLRHVIQATK
jgi:hypothetical protein